MFIYPRQFVASIVMSLCLLALVVRLVQKGKLDIAYCWVWLGIGLGAILVVVRYDWLVRLSNLIGAVAPTTTLFLMAFFVVLLMCLQFSLVISQQRRQIKRLTQEVALLGVNSSRCEPETNAKRRESARAQAPDAPPRTS